MDTSLLEEILDARSQRYARLGRGRQDALDLALSDFMDEAARRFEGSELYYFRAIMAGARSSLDYEALCEIMPERLPPS